MQDNSSFIEVVLDPLLDFKKLTTPPPARQSQLYEVVGYVGGGYHISTPQGRAANCYYAVNEVINQGLESLGRSFNWAKVNTLRVTPEMGMKWNAYYDRRGLRFFYNDDEINQRRVYASSAGKIVMHEAGHAILDAIRPDLFDMANFETWAVHEAFGDLTAFLGTMRNDELLTVRDKRIWTGIGIEFGAGSYGVKYGIYRPLRDLGMRFNWVPASTLPKTAPYEELAAEPHSFSRIFSSANYALFLKMVERNMTQAKPNPVRLAANTLSRYLHVGCSLSAVNEYYMDSVARAMMFVDWREGYPYLDLMNEVYGDQQILQPQKTLTALSLEPMLTKQTTSTVCLADEFISAQSASPLHYLKVQVGHDENSDRARILDDVQLCLDYLHRNDLVDRPGSPFATWKGRLLRRHFQCRFCTNN